MVEELIDRFGDIPKKVETLLLAASMKALAHSVYVTAVEQKGEVCTFFMYERAKVHPERIPQLLADFGGELSFKADPPMFVWQKKNTRSKVQNQGILEVVKNVLIGIKGLIDP